MVWIPSDPANSGETVPLSLLAGATAPAAAETPSLSTVVAGAGPVLTSAKWLTSTAPPPVTVTIKSREGGAWVTRTARPKVYVGGVWVTKRPKRWNGSAWVDLL